MNKCAWQLLVVAFLHYNQSSISLTVVTILNHPILTLHITQSFREFDAFVSYTYEASIDFVKKIVQPKLESEPNPPFKLFSIQETSMLLLLIIQME